MKCHGVLIVEDDEDVRATLEQVLVDHEVPTMTAANGALALAELRNARELPCLILLDMMMPVMDGREFCAQQQRDPELAQIPVVVISAHASGQRCTAGMGVDGFLQKPCKLEALLATVDRYVATAK